MGILSKPKKMEQVMKYSRNDSGIAYCFAAVGCVLGLIYGIYFSWSFTFETIVPWLEISKEFEKIAGLCIWFFGVLELSAAIWAIIGLASAGLVGLIIELAVAFYLDLKDKRRRAKENGSSGN